MPAPTSKTSVLPTFGSSDNGCPHGLRSFADRGVDVCRGGRVDAPQAIPAGTAVTAKVGLVTWEPDVLAGYWQRSLSLGTDPDGEGEIVATLVRRGDAAPARHAALVVHGFTDYFFHNELADHFAEHGCAVYALDLRKCGRSWREGQTPHFITDLARYDTELDWALETIAADAGAPNVLVYGHSAGGLIVTLWLDRRRRAGAGGLSGLVLNSPWFDLQGPAILRSAGTAAILALARLRRKQVIPLPREGAYGASLHRDYGGELDYDLQWKPIGGFPITYGWINAIRRGHAKLHRGLDVGVPNLILRSDHSIPGNCDVETAQRGDCVLEVSQIARWAGCVGNRTTVVPVADAKHDVFLSIAGPRRQAYRELGAWLGWYTTHLESSGAADLLEPEAEAGRRT
ncbi:MAG: alpha/beta hydrolase [Mycobacteriaceae bacterium]|nr:alpha/beta hydrolase [Mycobacteriaceae bacterium]